MEIIDPERERLRLREEYSRKMDGELERIAGDEFDLTDLASGILKEEMSRRGLSLQSRPRPTVKPVSMAEELANQGEHLCVVRRFASFPEALIAKTCLDSSGIECALADENVLAANPFLSQVLGGVRLFVREADLEEATKLLDEPIPEELEIQGIGKYVQPRCPQCFSLDITFGELKNAAKVSLPLGLPLPLRRDEWLCHTCSCRWTDSEEG
jgi:hypothetical protein